MATVAGLQKLMGPGWRPWRAAQRRGALQAALWLCLAGAAAGVGLGLAAARWARPQWSLWLATGGTLAGLGLGLATLLGGVLAGRRAALQLRLLESLCPELSSSLLSASSFLQGGAAPQGLPAQHVAWTQQRLAAIDCGGRLQQRCRGPLRRLAGTASALMLGALGMAAAWPSTPEALRAALTGAPQVRFVDEPLLGDIEVKTTYPDYTGLPPRTVQHSDGALRALIGSRIDLSGHVAGEATAVGLRLLAAGEAAGAHGAPTATLRPLGGGRFAASWTLHDAVGYQIMVRRGAIWYAERRPQPICVLPDGPPQITLELPAAATTLRPEESLTVQWRGSDDFGLSEATLQVGDTNRSIGSTPGRQKTHQGILRLRPDDLGLEPGIGRSLSVCLCDNRSPQRQCSRSATQTVTLYSSAAAHAALMDRQQVVLAASLDALAVLLDGTPRATPQAPSGEPLQQLVDLLVSNVAALRDDALAEAALRQANEELLGQMQGALRARRRNLPAATAERQRRRDIAGLEHHILYLDDLLAAGRLDDLKGAAHALLAAQGELRDLLQRYRRHPDAAGRRQLEERLAQNRRRIGELLQKMAQIRAQLPDAYRNVEAAADATVNRSLDAAARALQEDSLEDAAAHLEQLADEVSRMVDSFDTAQRDVGSGRYAEQRRAMQALGDGLQRLRRTQRQLLEDTQQLQKAAQQQALQQAGGQNALRRAAQRAAAAAQADLRALRAAPQPGGDAWEAVLRDVSEQLDNVVSLLQHDSFFEAEPLSTQLARASALLAGQWPAATAAQKLAQDAATLAQRCQALLRAAQSPLTPAQQQRLARLTAQQRGARQQAEALQHDMQAVQKEAPLIDGDSQAALQQSSDAMQQATAALGRSALSDASRAQRSALAALERLSEAARAAQGGGKGGMPSPLSMRQPGTGTAPGQAPGGSDGDPMAQGGGGDPQAQQPVEIPKALGNAAREQYRRELLDAARQAPPEKYRAAVRRYYEELLER